jgi:amidase
MTGSFNLVVLLLISVVVTLTLAACGDDDQGAPPVTSQPPIEEATVAELRAAMDAGRVSAVGLVEHYLARIEALDRNGPTLRAVIEVNPDARSLAQALDAGRQAQGARGSLHGIPVLLKDNIDTGDQMLTTAGSLALVGAPATRDATVAERLRQAGALLLGKTNLSEWANMRSLTASSGWSARGGQTLNPYALDHSPCGSSSGSAVAVAANLCAVALGTETDGSVVCPAAANSIVGLKPTVGLTSRAGVIPISHTQDTVGVLARTVADAATVLGALVGTDPRDPAMQASATHLPDNYTQFLDTNGLRNARIGIPRQVFFGKSPESDAIVEQAIAALRAAGATIIDPADVPTAASLAVDSSGFRMLLFELKADLNSYLQTRSGLGLGLGVATLGDLIAFNTAHADTELARFGQEIFELADPLGSLETPAYLSALAKGQRLSRDQGIDAVMDQHQLDALVAPTGPPPWVIDYSSRDPALGFQLHSVAARAGYPVITVPAGFASGLPVGISFVGRAFSEPTLIRLAYAFEQATHVRRAPQFLPHQTSQPVTREGRNR